MFTVHTIRFCLAFAWERWMIIKSSQTTSMRLPASICIEQIDQHSIPQITFSSTFLIWLETILSSIRSTMQFEFYLCQTDSITAPWSRPASMDCSRSIRLVSAQNHFMKKRQINTEGISEIQLNLFNIGIHFNRKTWQIRLLSRMKLLRSTPPGRELRGDRGKENWNV